MKKKAIANDTLAWIDSFSYIDPKKHSGPTFIEPVSDEMRRRQEFVKARIHENSEASRQLDISFERSNRADKHWIDRFSAEMGIEGPTTRNQRRTLHPAHTRYLNQNPKQARSLIEALFRWAENQAPESDFHEAREIDAPTNKMIRTLLSGHLTVLKSSINNPAKRAEVFDRLIFDVASIINSAAWNEENKTRLRSYLSLLEHISPQFKSSGAPGENQCSGYAAFLHNFARTHKMESLPYIELQLAYLKCEVSQLIKTYGAGVAGGNTSARDHLADEVVLLRLWGHGFSFGERLKLLNAALFASQVVKQSRRKGEEELFRQDKKWLERLEERHCELRLEFEADDSEDHTQWPENWGHDWL